MNDHIKLDNLEKGTKLNIHTRNSLYEVEIVEGEKVLIRGGTKRDGKCRFPEATPVVLYASTPDGFTMYRGEIRKNMRLQINEENQEYGSLYTSGVKEVEVIAPDGNWQYFMEWNNEHFSSPDN